MLDLPLCLGRRNRTNAGLIMTRRFDRTDGDARALRAAYKELADALNREAVDLRQDIHARHYPTFGPCSGLRKRGLVRGFRRWDMILRDQSAIIFRHSAEVEEKLVYTVAMDSRIELRRLHEQVIERRQNTDRILRAIGFRTEHYRNCSVINLEELYDFCVLIERSCQYFRFVSQVLFHNPLTIIGPTQDSSWRTLEGWGEILPDLLRRTGQSAPADQDLEEIEAETLVEPRIMDGEILTPQAKSPVTDAVGPGKVTPIQRFRDRLRQRAV